MMRPIIRYLSFRPAVKLDSSRDSQGGQGGRLKSVIYRFDSYSRHQVSLVPESELFKNLIQGEEIMSFAMTLVKVFTDILKPGFSQN
jgi:hypothetical protein